MKPSFYELLNASENNQKELDAINLSFSNWLKSHVNELVLFAGKHKVKPLFLSLVGSYNHGIATPESDLDLRMIYFEGLDNLLSVSNSARHYPRSLGKLNYVMEPTETPHPVLAEHCHQGMLDMQCMPLSDFIRKITDSNYTIIEWLVSRSYICQTFHGKDETEAGMSIVQHLNTLLSYYFDLNNFYKGIYYTLGNMVIPNGKAYEELPKNFDYLYRLALYLNNNWNRDQILFELSRYTFFLNKEEVEGYEEKQEEESVMDYMTRVFTALRKPEKEPQYYPSLAFADITYRNIVKYVENMKY